MCRPLQQIALTVGRRPLSTQPPVRQDSYEEDRAAPRRVLCLLRLPRVWICRRGGGAAWGLRLRRFTCRWRRRHGIDHLHPLMAYCHPHRIESPLCV